MKSSAMMVAQYASEGTDADIIKQAQRMVISYLFSVGGSGMVAAEGVEAGAASGGGSPNIMWKSGAMAILATSRKQSAEEITDETSKII